MSKKVFLSTSCILFILAAAYIWPVCFVLHHIPDQGMVWLGADVISRGGFLYRDMFAIQWPGSYWLLGILFSIFGTRIVVAQAAFFISLLLTGALLILLSRRLISSWLVFFPAAIFFIVGPPSVPCQWPQWDSLTAYLAMVLLAIKYLDKKEHQPLTLLLIGALGALSALAYQPTAAAVLAGFTGYSFLVAWRDDSPRWPVCFKSLVWLVTGFGLIVIAMLFYLLATGTFQDMVDCTVGFVLKQYQQSNTVPWGFSQAFNFIFGHVPTAPGTEKVAAIMTALGLLFWFPCEVIKATPLLVAAGCLIYLLRGGSWKTVLTRHPALATYLIFGFLFLAVLVHRADINRLYWGSQLLLIVLFRFLQAAITYLRYSRLSIRLFLVLMIAGLTAHASMFAFMYSQAKESVDTRAGRILSLDDLWPVETLEKLTSPYQKVLVYPYDPIIYFLSKTSFPSIHPWNQYQYNSMEQIQSTIDDMEKDKVEFVIQDISLGNDSYRDFGFPNYKPLPEKDLIVEKYLKQRYRPVRAHGKYLLLRRTKPEE